MALPGGGEVAEAEVKVMGWTAGGVSKSLSCSRLSSMRLILSASRGILHPIMHTI